MGLPNSVFRRQNTTLLMALAITRSSAARRGSRLSVPPSATCSLSTDASVTSFLVRNESRSEMRVAKRLFYTHHNERTRDKDHHAYREPVQYIDLLPLDRVTAIVSTGNRERISLIESCLASTLRSRMWLVQSLLDSFGLPWRCGSVRWLNGST